MRIVSVPGRLVRDPATHRPVTEAGVDVDPHDLHWARLLADGDVQRAPDRKPARKASASPEMEG